MLSLVLVCYSLIDQNRDRDLTITLIDLLLDRDQGSINDRKLRKMIFLANIHIYYVKIS